MKNIYKIFMIFIFVAEFALANVPSVHSIYQAVKSGHIRKAQYMIEEVLKAYPKSAKAHYVAAQILVREGKAKAANHELQIAKNLDPSMSFVNQEDVIKLQHRIDSLESHPIHHNVNSVPQEKHSWVKWVIFIIAILIIFFIIRGMMQRRRYISNSSNPNSPIHGGGSGLFGGGGFFSNLFSGLAMGAGFAAGEKIVDDLTGSKDETTDSQDSNQVDNNDNQEYADLDDDNDFGIDDSSSWNDDEEYSFNDDSDFDMGDDSW